jgi:hypothetical protein
MVAAGNSRIEALQIRPFLAATITVLFDRECNPSMSYLLTAMALEV